MVDQLNRSGNRLQSARCELAEAAAWLERQQENADRSSASPVAVSCDGVPAAVFLMSETVRSESRQALMQLVNAAVSVHVLSGDRPEKARFIRDQLQIPGLEVECGLQPEQKVGRVEELRRRHGTTVMVGDGINDAPALAASDVGIALGCGADVSRDSAQVCLLSNDLMHVPWAIELAKRTRGVIRQNLAWAFGYNSVGVVAASLGWLNPALAAGLMIASSLIVISNSLRLLRDHDEELCADGEGQS